MTPQQQHQALAALARRSIPPMPARPSRAAVASLLRSASLIPPGPPAAALSRATRLIGRHAAAIPDPMLLDAATRAAIHFAGKHPVATDPSAPWLDVLLPDDRRTPFSARPKATLAALAVSPAPWTSTLPLPSQALVAVNPRSTPSTLSGSRHSLHLALWLTCPNASIAVWRRSGQRDAQRRDLPSIAALAAALREALENPDSRNPGHTAPDAASRAVTAFRDLETLSARALPQKDRVNGTWAPWRPSFEFIRGKEPSDPDAEICATHKHPTPLAIPGSLQDIRIPTPKPSPSRARSSKPAPCPTPSWKPMRSPQTRSRA